MNDLPVFPTPFVGRQQELNQIDELLKNPDCRLLTLQGPGGIGKTRLALEAAQRHEAYFPDGISFAALQPLTSPDLLISAVAGALHLQFYPGMEPKRQLFDYLQEKHLLLVLDNFEHLLDAAEIVSDLLADSPQLKIITTSRQRLNLVEEWVLNVEGLSVPAENMENDVERYEAVQLFVQSARRVQVGFKLAESQKRAVARICQLVEGMPLGIELAAAWVRALSCQEIALEIERSIDILETPARNMPARHRNMRAALAHSWNLLSATEQDVFKRLSVFRGGFTREAAEAVAGASIWILTALVDKSLIRADGRYHLQELLRQYAEEQLVASGESEIVRQTHSAYYADFLQSRWHTLKTHRQRQALDDIDAELDNIRVAWQTLCRQRNVLGLAAAARSLWLGSDLRCRFHEMVAFFKEAVDALRPIAGTPEVDQTLGLLLAFLGWPHVGLGLPEKGHRFAQEAVEILQRVGTTDDLLLAVLSLQLTTHYINHLPECLRVSEMAIELARRSGDPWGLARTLYEFANFKLSYTDNPETDDEVRRVACEEAGQLGEEAMVLADSCGDLWLRASISGFLLGNVNRLLKDYAEARRRYEQSLPLFERVGQTWAMGAIYRIIGLTNYLLKDYAAAFDCYLKSLRIFHDNGQPHEQIWLLYYFGELFAAMGENERAVKLVTVAAHHPASLNLTRLTAQQFLTQQGFELSADSAFSDLESEIMRLLEHPSIQEQSDLLTARELEILQLMASGMTNREIADRLILSPGTVKWYTSQIFAKLNVQNRVQALTRAQELNLLP